MPPRWPKVADSTAFDRVRYLASYAHMGVCTLRCFDGCACAPQTLDAHAPAQNLSAWRVHAWELVGASARCVLQLVVKERSRSGQHHFKLRDVAIRPALPLFVF